MGWVGIDRPPPSTASPRAESRGRSAPAERGGDLLSDQEPVNSGSCLARNDMIPIAASVVSEARAKFSDSRARA